MKKGSKYIIASVLSVFLFCFCLFLEAKPVLAAVTQNGITIKISAYVLKEKLLTVDFSRDDGEIGLKYFVRYGNEEISYMFENATCLEASSGQVILDKSGFLYVWKAEAQSCDDCCRRYLIADISSIAMYDGYGATVEAETYLDKTKYPVTIEGLKVHHCLPHGMKGYVSIFDDSDAIVCLQSALWSSPSDVFNSEEYDEKVTDLSYMLCDSGTYRYRLVMYNEEESIYCDLGEHEFVYTRPEVSVAKVNYAEWSKDDIGKIVVSFPEENENIRSYWAIVEKRTDSNESWSFRFEYPNATKDELLNYDFGWILEEGYEYRVGVRTVSNDVATYANSDLVYSDVYDPSAASEDVIENIEDVLENLGVDSIEEVRADSLQEIYDQATEEEKAAIVEATKGALEDLPTNELRVSMQTNSDVLDLVSTIEEMYGATVDVNIDEDVQAVIDTGSVTVLGAGLNAESISTPVTVDIRHSDVEVDSNLYKNAIPLEISISGVKDTGETLAIPVTVSMIVPAGIDFDNIVVLHHKADGSLDEKLKNDTLYKNAITREIRFTVTHFSPFVIAEEQIADILKAQLYIGQDFKLLYKAAVDASYSNVQMRFTSPLCNRVVDGVYDAESGNYLFEFTGIGPQCLADEIDVELLCDGNVMDRREGFSVKKYCDAVAAKTAGELGMTEEQFGKLKTLMADMLEYGAEAQKYVNYNLSSLANTSSWVSTYRTATYTAPVNPVVSSTTAVGEDKVKSVALDVRSVNKIVFKVNVANENSVKAKVYNVTKGTLVSEEALNEIGEHLVYTDAIYSTGYDDVYRIDLVGATDEILHSAQFSSSAYINTKSEDAVLGDLVKRLYIYGKSAQNYQS